MILRGVGKVRSFRISPRLFIWAVLFFIAYLLCSVIIINEYIGLRKRTALQSQKIEVLETRSVKDQKDLIRFKQHIALLEDYIQSLEEQKEEAPAASPRTEEPAVKKASPASPVQAEKPRPAEPKEITSTVVDVKDLVIQKEHDRMRVSFKLVNILEGDEAVAGYYHIIAKDESSNPPGIWTYPQQELVNGLPSSFKRGKVFLIQRFKPIHWWFDIPPGFNPPSSITVLVYDQAGDLILRKLFEVDHES